MTWLEMEQKIKDQEEEIERLKEVIIELKNENERIEEDQWYDDNPGCKDKRVIR